MTEIERKALALIAEIKAERGLSGPDYLSARAALIRAIEQHEAFKREVSDAVEKLMEWPSIRSQAIIVSNLSPFLITKPDPLVEILLEEYGHVSADADAFRQALAARGLQITEVGQ